MSSDRQALDVMRRLHPHAFEMEDGGSCKPVRIKAGPSSCSDTSLKRLLSPPDLIQASQDQTNVNVPQMVDTLMERVGNASWVVVFKALITTHHLMVHGHEVRIAVRIQPGWS